MRIAEAFCKMRLSEYCTSQDIDRAIAVTVDSFVGSQKVSCKKALARAFAKYVYVFTSLDKVQLADLIKVYSCPTGSCQEDERSAGICRDGSSEGMSVGVDQIGVSYCAK